MTNPANTNSTCAIKKTTINQCEIQWLFINWGFLWYYSIRSSFFSSRVIYIRCWPIRSAL